MTTVPAGPAELLIKGKRQATPTAQQIFGLVIDQHDLFSAGHFLPELPESALEPKVITPAFPETRIYATR